MNANSILIMIISTVATIVLLTLSGMGIYNDGFSFWFYYGTGPMVLVMLPFSLLVARFSYNSIDN